MRSTLLLGIVLLCASAHPAVAQGPSRVGLTARAERSPPPKHSTFVVDSRPTHWKEGMLYGAAVGLVGGFLLDEYAKRSCDSGNCSDSAALIFVPAVVFSLVGGLIGASIPKRG
ncbi:MAG TPA: hypothetical protein VGM20_08815 [Gemmatimonadales bacterium]|jgi:hypothetical protein